MRPANKLYAMNRHQTAASNKQEVKTKKGLVNEKANSLNLILLLVPRYKDSLCAGVAMHPKTKHLGVDN